MKRLILSAIVLGMAAGAAPQAYAADPVTIGAIAVLSGPNARYGNAQQNAIKLALEEINAAGGVLGGRPLELVLEDSAGTKEQAINAGRKLVARDKVTAIIGPTLSNETFAVGPVTNERKVPLVTSSSTANGITDIGPYVFRTALPEADVIPVTLKTVKEKFGVKNVAVMYGNDDAFTKSGYDVFKAALEKLGINTLTTETFGGKDTDFSAQLTKIKSLNPDAIVVSALVEAAAGILLQARQLGIPEKVFFVGGNGFNSAKLSEIAGPSAEGTLVGSPWFLGKDDAKNKAFVQAYVKKFQQEPDQFSAQAYDTTYIVAEAINKAGSTDTEKVRDALAATKYTGVTGPFSFTPERNPASTEGVVVLVTKGGKFTILQ